MSAGYGARQKGMFDFEPRAVTVLAMHAAEAAWPTCRAIDERREGTA